MTVDHSDVSVIICAFNAAATIRDTITTLQEQSLRPAQILVIDDGSSDGTVSVVREAVDSDPTIQLIVNAHNQGTARSRQKGIEAADNELVMFFDADDLAHPSLIGTLAERLLSDPDCMGASCYATYFDETGNLGVQRIGALNREEFLNSWRAGKLYFQSIVTLSYRSLMLRAGGFRQNIYENNEGIRYEDYAEDLDLWCRMSDFAEEGRYFVSVPEPLFKYRKPMGSLSTRNLKLMQLKMRWIKDCLKRRRAGQQERSLERFISSRTLWERLSDRRSDLAATFYKRAGFAWMTRDWLRLILFLSLSGLFSPKLIRQKIRSQAISR